MRYSSILLNMQNVKLKIIVILGPTASGKSDAAIKLAKKFNGEIISADSRQIYKGMDIGTGKVTGSLETVILSEIESRPKRDEMKSKDPNNQFTKLYISEGAPHHLIDVAEPMEDFNVSHFKKLANEAIEEILAKGKLPIICGGTGFWIQAITDDLKLPEVPPNEKLRNELDKLSEEELFAELEKLDLERAANIDRQNKYRLIRAIEICEAIGKVPNKSSVIGHRSSEKYEFLQIGIGVPREILNEKIKKRLEARFKENMIEEVERLHKQGVSWEWMEKIGLEYRWIARFLQNKISLEEMQEKLYYDIIHYAKRQMTWFKKNKKILWKENYSEIEKEVEKFL